MFLILILKNVSLATVTHTKFLSLMFERAHGWTGLLVEAHPTQFYKVSLWMENRKLSKAQDPIQDQDEEKLLWMF